MLSPTNQPFLFLPLSPNSNVYGKYRILWPTSNMNKTNKKSNGNLHYVLCIEHADIERTKQISMRCTTWAMASRLRLSNR